MKCLEFGRFRLPLWGGQSFRYIQDHLYFVSTDGFSSYVFKVDGKGGVTQLTKETGSVDATAYMKTALLLLVYGFVSTGSVCFEGQ